MSLYNILFGMNPQADLLLAVIGLRKHDIERFRDVFASEDGSTITVHTRTGGGNREDYPNLALRKAPGWSGSVDDDFDSTYCNDTFVVPEQWREDVKGLSDMLGNGIRREFGAHLLATLRREPNESDKAQAAYDAEAAEIRQLDHFLANGHTFVPKNDAAMEAALKIAEANDGKLRTAWGILPLTLTVKRDFIPWPNARNDDDRQSITRVDVNYEWTIDEAYWKHCRERWASKYPITMAKVQESVDRQLAERSRA